MGDGPAEPATRCIPRSRVVVVLVVLAALLTTILSTVTVATPSSATPGHRRKQSPAALVVGQPSPSIAARASSVSCPTPQRCWVVGSEDLGGIRKAWIEMTHDGGFAWRPQRAPASVSTLSSISCTSDSGCVAVGTSTEGQAITVLTRDGGSTWTIGGPLAGASEATSVDCRTVFTCIAIVASGAASWSVRTGNGGLSWQRDGDLPPGFSGPGPLFCSSTERCLVAGYTPIAPARGTGAIASTADGGSTWALDALPQGVGLLHGVACLANLCIAVGTASTTDTAVIPAKGMLLRSDDAGRTWATSPWPAGLSDAFGINCVAPATCVVVGTSWLTGRPAIPTGFAITTINRAGSWQLARTRYVANGLVSIDCGSQAACVAVGGSEVATVRVPSASVQPAGIGS